MPPKDVHVLTGTCEYVGIQNKRECRGADGVKVPGYLGGPSLTARVLECRRGRQESKRLGRETPQAVFGFEGGGKDHNPRNAGSF